MAAHDGRLSGGPCQGGVPGDLPGNKLGLSCVLSLNNEAIYSSISYFTFLLKLIPWVFVLALALMAALLTLSNVGVLADTVQMAYAGEPLDAIGRVGSALMHVHTGCALTRSLPSADDGEDYPRLFRLLARSAYSGRVSAVTSGECTVDAAARALDCLRRAREESLT